VTKTDRLVSVAIMVTETDVIVVTETDMIVLTAAVVVEVATNN
jgi:hypothetical protein